MLSGAARETSLGKEIAPEPKSQRDTSAVIVMMGGGDRGHRGIKDDGIKIKLNFKRRNCEWENEKEKDSKGM